MNGINRHWALGYRRNFINDVYGVEKQLQAYDKDLYIMWRDSDNTWLIMDDIMNAAVMKIPQIGFETLDSRLVEHFKKIHTARGFNVSWELKESENRRQRELDRQQEDLSYWLAQDMKRPIIEAHDYGNV